MGTDIEFHLSNIFKTHVTGDLVDFAEDHESKVVMFNYIYQVRWVTATKTAMEKIIHNFPEMIGHFTRVMNDKEGFSKATRKKAGTLSDKFARKNTAILMIYNLDVQDGFSKASLISQSNGESGKC